MSDQLTPTPEAPNPEPQAEPRTFTQEELDRHIADRLKRQKAQFETQLSETEQLREKAAKFDEFEKAQMSEADRLRAEAQAAAEKAAALEAELNGVRFAERKRAILDEKGLDPNLANLLRGDDEASFIEAVDSYISVAGQGAPKVGNDLAPQVQPITEEQYMKLPSAERQKILASPDRAAILPWANN